MTDVTDKENRELLFRILRIGLGTENGGVPGKMPCGTTDTDWRAIFSLGAKHGVGAIMFDGVQDLHRHNCKGLPGKELMMEWLAHTAAVENLCKRQKMLAGELAETFAQNGIRTIVLKGIAAGQNYPRPDHRPCCDFDCFLPGNYERGNHVAREAGAEVRPDYYKHSHILYKGMAVENHRFCTPIRGSRRMKRLEKVLQEIIAETRGTKIEGTELECPPTMFNALFLTEHAHCHLLTEGITLRHLCDWAMFLKEHGNEADWDFFRPTVEKMGFTPFAETMTRLSAKYLGVALPAGYRPADNAELDRALMDDILNLPGRRHHRNNWATRFEIAKDIIKNRRRHKLFSDKPMTAKTIQLAWGFCFDRLPKL